MKNVFFDLDGTLHKEDLLAAFLKYLLKRRIGNLLFLLPFSPLVLLIYRLFPTRKFSLNCLLFFISFGCSDARLKQYLTDFNKTFRLTPFPQPLSALQRHLDRQDRIWIISGSPIELISLFYIDLLQSSQIHLIGSTFIRRYGAILLNERCLAEQKVRMLDTRFQPPIQFDIGYSDSMTDLPMFKRCKQAMWITPEGEIKPLAL